MQYVNNAFEKLTGYSLGDINGQDFNKVHRLNPNEFSTKTSPPNVSLIVCKQMSQKW